MERRRKSNEKKRMVEFTMKEKKTGVINKSMFENNQDIKENFDKNGFCKTCMNEIGHHYSRHVYYKDGWIVCLEIGCACGY